MTDSFSKILIHMMSLLSIQLCASPLLAVEPTNQSIGDIIGISLPSESLGRSHSLLGEWVTAGIPEPDYHPTYPYRYICQVELSDQNWTTDSVTGHRSKIVGVSRFVLGSENGSFVGDFTKLNWVWLRYYSSRSRKEVLLDEKPPGSPSLDHHWVSLRFSPGENITDDIVHLGLRLALPVGDYIVPAIEFAEARRAEKQIFLTQYSQADAAIDHDKNKSIARKLFVLCEKDY